jgi:hypothetical protein
MAHQDRQQEQEFMNRRGTMTLFQYWNRLRGDRPAPLRTEIEPADIKTLLGDTFILEKDADGRCVFRLAGTRLCAAFCRELKGAPFPLLWARRDQRMIDRLVHGVLHEGSVVALTLDGVSQRGRVTRFEILLLPLDSGSDSVRALGVMTPFEQPYWLGVDPLTECRVETLRIVDPDREPQHLPTRPAIPVPPIAPGSDRMLREAPSDGPAGRRIRHLVVIEGGRGG